MVVYQLNEFYLNRKGQLKKRILEKWEKEPNFVDEFYEKYHMVVWRNPVMGQLNGYVGVKRDHPYFGKKMYDKHLSGISVHSGITFAGKIIGGGFKKGYWYFGFDTAHTFDLVPGMKNIMNIAKESGDPLIAALDQLLSSFSLPNGFNIKKTYKDIEYVTNEVEQMFFQLEMVKRRNTQYKHNFVREYKQLHREKVKFRQPAF